MQINANNYLPVVTGLRQEPVRRDNLALPPRLQRDTQALPDRLNEEAQNQPQTHRRPPLFMQALADTDLPRRGQQAMRAYHDAAMAGDKEELVNRINEIV